MASGNGWTNKGRGLTPISANEKERNVEKKALEATISTKITEALGIKVDIYIDGWGAGQSTIVVYSGKYESGRLVYTKGEKKLEKKTGHVTSEIQKKILEILKEQIGGSRKKTRRTKRLSKRRHTKKQK